MQLADYSMQPRRFSYLVPISAISHTHEGRWFNKLGGNRNPIATNNYLTDINFVMRINVSMPDRLSQAMNSNNQLKTSALERLGVRTTIGQVGSFEHPRTSDVCKTKSPQTSNKMSMTSTDDMRHVNVWITSI